VKAFIKSSLLLTIRLFSSFGRKCRARVAECTVAEVIHFTKVKAAVLATGKSRAPPNQAAMLIGLRVVIQT
jgi:hypothetical protein